MFGSLLPITTRIEEAPLKSASPARLSAFHADKKCDTRSSKSFLSILISPMATERCGMAEGCWKPGWEESRSQVDALALMDFRKGARINMA